MKHDNEYYELLHMHIHDEITPHMIGLMQRAVGFDRSNVKRGIYRAYRNYYTVPCPDDGWDKIVALGLADVSESEKGVVYWVTKAGFAVMEYITDIDIRMEEQENDR